MRYTRVGRSWNRHKGEGFVLDSHGAAGRGAGGSSPPGVEAPRWPVTSTTSPIKKRPGTLLAKLFRFTNKIPRFGERSSKHAVLSGLLYLVLCAIRIVVGHGCCDRFGVRTEIFLENRSALIDDEGHYTGRAIFGGASHSFFFDGCDPYFEGDEPPGL